MAAGGIAVFLSRDGRARGALLTADLFSRAHRAAKNRDEEQKKVNKEMAHIRAKFKDAKNLDSYARRKYTCKLLYCYMLGYEVDFGHMEALQLMSRYVCARARGDAEAGEGGEGRAGR